MDRGLLVAGATAVAAVITAATVIIAYQGGPSLPPPSQGAVQLLAKVAAVAARCPMYAAWAWSARSRPKATRAMTRSPLAGPARTVSTW